MEGIVLTVNDLDFAIAIKNTQSIPEWVNEFKKAIQRAVEKSKGESTSTDPAQNEISNLKHQMTMLQQQLEVERQQRQQIESILAENWDSLSQKIREEFQNLLLQRTASNK